MTYNFRYTTLNAIKRTLASRLEIAEDIFTNTSRPISISGQRTSILLELVYEYGQEVEEGLMDTYLSMIYEMPLKLTETSTVSYLNSVARDYIAGACYENAMPLRSENPDGADIWGSIKINRAVNMFQALFYGTGIVVPNINVQNVVPFITNDENRAQQQNKPIILKGEVLKGYIGYDYDNDGISDTDIYKKNPRREDNIYQEGDYKLYKSNFIESGVQTRKYRNIDIPISEIINFW